jgi:hypothetical protein
MRVLALLSAPSSKLLVIVLTFFWNIVKLVRWSSVIEGFVGIDTVIPVMIFRLIGAKRCLISVDVENYRVDCFQVDL